MESQEKYELDDILFIAVKIEKNGETFYKTLAQKTHNTKNRNILQLLSEEEKSHGDAFLDFYSELKERMHDFSCHFLQKAPRLSSLADENVFTAERMSTMIKEERSETELIDAAIKAEEDTKQFYEELKKAVDEKYISIIDKIIEEEEGHKEKLIKLKEKM